jgi:hypothetical protein
MNVCREDSPMQPEQPISSSDVTTIMGVLGDIRADVRMSRLLLEEDDGGEEAEARDPDG